MKTLNKNSSNLIDECEKYQDLMKKAEMLKLSLQGHLSESERKEKSSELVQVKMKMSEVMESINNNGHHPYLSH